MGDTRYLTGMSWMGYGGPATVSPCRRARPSVYVRIPTIPARDSNLKAATIPIEGGQHCPSARSWGHSAGEASRPDRLAAIFRMLSPFNVSR